MRNFLIQAVIVTALSWTVLPPQIAVAYNTGVVINGHHLSPAELAKLQYQLNTRVRRGIYQVDFNTGCWFNRSTGEYGCVRQRRGTGGGSPADAWVSPEELTHGGIRGVRPGPLSTYDFIK